MLEAISLEVSFLDTKAYFPRVVSNAYWSEVDHQKKHKSFLMRTLRVNFPDVPLKKILSVFQTAPRRIDPGKCQAPVSDRTVTKHCGCMLTMFLKCRTCLSFLTNPKPKTGDKWAT